jgi:hypothetical protein
MSYPVFTVPDTELGIQVAMSDVLIAWSNLSQLVDCGGSREELRAAIEQIEVELAKMPQADHGLAHHFSDGLYLRQANILAGTLFTTPYYREECFLTVLTGRIIVVTECGAQSITAPYYTKTSVGTKRVIFALDDVEAFSVHPNPDNEHDIDKLSARIYTDSCASLSEEL